MFVILQTLHFLLALFCILFSEEVERDEPKLMHLFKFYLKIIPFRTSATFLISIQVVLMKPHVVLL